MATPGYQSASMVPVIPTGYEALGADAATKHELAKALLAQGLASHSNYTSPFQALGQIAQAWAGGHLEKKAKMEDQQARDQIMAGHQAGMDQLATMVAAKASPQDIAMAMMKNPFMKEDAKPFVDAWSKGMETQQVNANTVETPKMILGPDGKEVLAGVDKTGVVHQTPGGYSLPPEISNVNGIAVALQDQKPGTVLPADPGQEFNHAGAPNANFISNTGLIAAKQAIANAGAAKYNAQFVNTGETEYGKKVGGALGDADAAAIAAARDAPTKIASAQRVLNLLKTNPITGTAAEQRLTLNRLMATAGIVDGKKVANTEALQAELAQGTLSMIKQSGLGSGNGFTDKDREFLQDATSGRISLSPQGLARLAQLSTRAAQISMDKGKRVIGRLRSNPATANLADGFDEELKAGTPAAAPNGQPIPQKFNTPESAIDYIMRHR